MAELTNDEMNILSTALIALVDSRACTRDKKGRYVVRCGDGRKRRLSQDEFLAVADKLAVLAGHGSVKDDALAVAEEAGLR